MRPDELLEFKQAVREVVAESHGVLHSDLRKDIQELKTEFKKYEPTLKAISNLTWTGKAVVAFIIAIGALTGAIMAIQGFIKSYF